MLLKKTAIDKAIGGQREETVGKQRLFCKSLACSPGGASHPLPVVGASCSAENGRYVNI